MKVLILSCGRTGTNMLLEILRGSKILVATNPAEDKTIFRAPRPLHKKYLSKCDTVYVDNMEMVTRLLRDNLDLKILWTIRDLRDCALSKIYRGQPGNDSGPTECADDATYDGCLEDIEWMHKIYLHIKETFPSRLKVVKMEDVIQHFDQTIGDVCSFIGIPFEENMRDFTSRYRVSYKAKRYKKLDTTQVGLHHRREDIYDGFFKNHDMDLDSLFIDLEKYLKEFGYE